MLHDFERFIRDQRIRADELARTGIDPQTGYQPGREPTSPYWTGPAGAELRRLERLAHDWVLAGHG